MSERDTLLTDLPLMSPSVEKFTDPMSIRRLHTIHLAVDLSVDLHLT